MLMQKFARKEFQIFSWRFPTAFYFCVIIFVCSFLTACFGPAPVQMTTYQLQEVSYKKLASTPSCTTLLVALPTTSQIYHSKNMLYSINEYQTQPFAKNQWAAPPAQMLLPLIVISLRNTNYFHAVVPSPYPGKTDYQLTTQLLQFQQYFSEDTSDSYFKMSLLATLTSNKSHKAVAERRFDATVAAPERSPYGGVIAANHATGEILTELSTWAVYRLRSRPLQCYR